MTCVSDVLDRAFPRRQSPLGRLLGLQRAISWIVYRRADEGVSSPTYVHVEGYPLLVRKVSDVLAAHYVITDLHSRTPTGAGVRACWVHTITGEKASTRP